MADAPILDELHTIQNWETASDFEKKHTPHIEVERAGDRYRVHYEVGYQVPHPNEPGHFIEWIDVYADDAPVARATFSAGVAWPKGCLEVTVDPGTRLYAIENCNLHGRWRSLETVTA